MSLVVQKYGGSSVQSAERIKRVAERIVATAKAGHEVCVVVSAMGDTTDDLLDLAAKVTPHAGRPASSTCFSRRVSASRMALLSMAINQPRRARRAPTRAARPA